MTPRARLWERFDAMHIRYRWASPADYSELGEVMFRAVRYGPSLYSDAQRAAWVAEPRQGEEWNARLAKQDIALAQWDENITGFMSLEAEGYIDFVYILAEHQGTGLFRKLFGMIHAHARTQGATQLWTHASLMARPAFAAMGFAIAEKENIALNGQNFERFKMCMIMPQCPRPSK